MVHNADIARRAARSRSTASSRSFAMNHLAPFALSHLALDALRAANGRCHRDRVAHQRGELDLDDLEHTRGSRYATYTRSKLSNVLFAARARASPRPRRRDLEQPPPRRRWSTKLVVGLRLQRNDLWAGSPDLGLRRGPRRAPRERRGVSRRRTRRAQRRRRALLAEPPARGPRGRRRQRRRSRRSAARGRRGGRARSCVSWPPDGAAARRVDPACAARALRDDGTIPRGGRRRRGHADDRRRGSRRHAGGPRPARRDRPRRRLRGVPRAALVASDVATNTTVRVPAPRGGARVGARAPRPRRRREPHRAPRPRRRRRGLRGVRRVSLQHLRARREARPRAGAHRLRRRDAARLVWRAPLDPPQRARHRPRPGQRSAIVRGTRGDIPARRDAYGDAPGASQRGRTTCARSARRLAVVRGLNGTSGSSANRVQPGDEGRAPRRHARAARRSPGRSSPRTGSPRRRAPHCTGEVSPAWGSNSGGQRKSFGLGRWALRDRWRSPGTSRPSPSGACPAGTRACARRGERRSAGGAAMGRAHGAGAATLSGRARGPSSGLAANVADRSLAGNISALRRNDGTVLTWGNRGRDRAATGRPPHPTAVSLPRDGRADRRGPAPRLRAPHRRPRDVLGARRCRALRDPARSTLRHVRDAARGRRAERLRDPPVRRHGAVLGERRRGDDAPERRWPRRPDAPRDDPALSVCRSDPSRRRHRRSTLPIGAAVCSNGLVRRSFVDLRAPPRDRRPGTATRARRAPAPTNTTAREAHCTGAPKLSPPRPSSRTEHA